METNDKALISLELIKERKALNPVLLKVDELTSIADYFLIVSGSSSRQVQAICRHLRRGLRDRGVKPMGVEGEQEGQWILMDYGDLVIHLFYEPIREFYDLEGLWIDAPRVRIDD